jgi:hypothetical protein
MHVADDRARPRHRVAVGRDGIFLGLAELTSNVWLATWPEGW